MADNTGVTAEELFSRAMLIVPEPDKVVTGTDLQGIQHRGGVYVFFNEFGECLYVGISTDLSKRVPAHLHEGRGNKDLTKYINEGNRVTVELRYEDNASYRELYESYLIIQLVPRFNVAKTEYEKL